MGRYTLEADKGMYHPKEVRQAKPLVRRLLGAAQDVLNDPAKADSRNALRLIRAAIDINPFAAFEVNPKLVDPLERFIPTPTSKGFLTRTQRWVEKMLQGS